MKGKICFCQLETPVHKQDLLLNDILKCTFDEEKVGRNGFREGDIRVKPLESE